MPSNVAARDRPDAHAARPRRLLRAAAGPQAPDAAGRPGRSGAGALRRRHECPRHRAAPHELYGSGKVIGSLHSRHRAIEFKQFLATIDREVPADLEVHIVLDNSSTHKTPAIKKWLLAHPRFVLHFTPTSSSWLNLVERWFGELLVWFTAYHLTAFAAIDQRTLNGFQGLLRPETRDGRRRSRSSSTPGPFALFAAALVLVALVRRRPRTAVAVAAILAGSNLTTQLLKPALATPQLVSWIETATWPSGHATTADGTPTRLPPPATLDPSCARPAVPDFRYRHTEPSRLPGLGEANEVVDEIPWDVIRQRYGHRLVLVLPECSRL